MKAKIAVKRIAPEEVTEPTRIGLNFDFDTTRIGPERTLQVWQGVGMIVAAVLDENELREFQQKLLTAQKQAKKRGTK